MSAGALVQRVAIAQHHLETIRQFTSVSPDHQVQVSESLRELESTLKELSIAVESLPQQDHAPTSQITFDVAEQARAQEALRESEERFRSAFDDSAVAMALTSPDLRLLRVNPAYCKLTGFDEAELLGRSVLELTHPDDVKPTHSALDLVVKGKNRTLRFEKRYLGKGGRLIWIDVSSAPVRDAQGNTLYLVTHVQDITERKQAEEALHRLNRTLTARSHSDQALMRATNEAEYMQQVCQIIIEDCGHAMAWVGFAEEDEAKSVRPVAYAGLEEGYLETLHITWTDTELGRGPTGTAIRTGQPSFCRNMLSDPKFAPWRAEALKRGYASSLVLPLVDQRRTFGALTIYFREPDPFTVDEIALLSGLADDLAYGIKTLRLRAAHAQVEAALRESEERAKDQAARLQAILDAAPAIIWIAHDRECQSITGNRASQELLRVPEGLNVSKSGPAPELLAHYRVFKDGAELAPQDMPIQRTAASGQGFNNYAMEIVFDDGSERSLLGNVTPILDSAGRPNGAIAAFMDVTTHKRAAQERERLLEQVEQQRQRAEQLAATAERHANELDAVFDAMTDAVVVYDAAGMARRVNPAAEAIYGPDLMRMDRPTLARQMGVRGADGCPAATNSLPAMRALRGEKVTNEYFTFTDPNGRERIVLASASPLRTRGNVSGAVAVWHDMTEREQIVAQLEDERARLKAIIENAPEAIIVTDQQGQVILSNPAAESLGVRAALSHPAESQMQCEVRYPGDAPGDSSQSPLVRSASEGQTLKNFEMTITYSFGWHRVFLGGTAPIRDRLGKITGAVGVFEDITLREQVEEALEQSNRDMLMLNHLGQELGSTLNLTQVLERILEAINVLIPAEVNSVWLWDEERAGWLVCKAALGFLPGQSPVNMRVRTGEGIVGWVAEHRESVVTSRLTEDPRFVPTVYTQTGSHARSILAVPLLVRDSVTGILAIVNRSMGEFDARDRTLAETLAASAAIAVENARLHDQAMQAAVTAERSRLARDLHDAVSQTLFSASVISETLPRLWKRDPARVERGLEQLHQLTRGALAEMRALLVELRPTALVETDLGDLLHQLAEATMSRTRIAASVAIEGKRALPPEVQIALYRIAQEALNNVVKHAHASQVTLSLLNLPPGQVELRIKDDGRGFDPARVMPGHLGLDIMRERAQSIGITLEIASQPGQGAEIVATCACAQ